MSDDLSTSTTIPQSVLDRLAPDYRAFVETQPATSRIPLYTIDLNSAFRQSLKLVPPLDLGQADYIPVGSTRTIQLGQFSVLVLTPEGERPSGGWPAFLFIHGGGWVLGTVETGKQFYSRACVEAKCVVVSVDYRLAPEHPFPAAVEDCWEALRWLCGVGKDELEIDVSRIAVGGVSAGGNIAAVIAQRASLASPRVPLVLQILTVPATNLTFTALDKSNWTPSMVEHQDVFALRALEMFWCRDYYVPKVEDRVNPDASPLLQEDKRAYEGLPPALVLVMELDVLKSEAEMYAEKMKLHGVPVTLKEYKGSELEIVNASPNRHAGVTHLSVAADRVCEIACTIRSDQIEALKTAFAK
ncbi:hypothetical protein CTheo_7339 [Ceratobasidium theobromae]|uniref:Alpha/beta hydrolase fold-3 domain-containing protein n=1 Tax=Ceratobasidium theobromae TaxID=1582974 RepID=A0A5N5QCN0_9AGAM|nr:hypothetical protein CTheo_7339 [Ceratobasidium theobromae]